MRVNIFNKGINFRSARTPVIGPPIGILVSHVVMITSSSSAPAPPAPRSSGPRGPTWLPIDPVINYPQFVPLTSLLRHLQPSTNSDCLGWELIVCGLRVFVSIPRTTLSVSDKLN